MSNNEEKQLKAESSSEEQARPEESAISPKRALHAIFDVIESFAFSAIAVLIICAFFFRVTTVDGPSMEDTLHNGESLLVSRAFYTPEPGDVIVLHQPTENYPNPIVKRVIAVGGQTVDIDFNSWTVTVDGVKIEEDYIKLTNDQRITSNLTYPLYVPEGYIFVMGDNRNHSADSRLAEIGLIDTRSVLGKVIFRIFPFSVAGTVN